MASPADADTNLKRALEQLNENEAAVAEAINERQEWQPSCFFMRSDVLPLIRPGYLCSLQMILVFVKSRRYELGDALLRAIGARERSSFATLCY